MSVGVKDYENVHLSGNLDKDIALFKNIFSRDAVLRTREVSIAGSWRCCLIYIDGMVDSLQQGETIIEALVKCTIPQETSLDCDYISKNILFAKSYPLFQA